MTVYTRTTEEIIPQLSEIAIRDLLWIILEAVDQIHARGLKVTLTPKPLALDVWKKGAIHFGRAMHVDGAFPLWFGADTQTVRPNLPLDGHWETR